MSAPIAVESVAAAGEPLPDESIRSGLRGLGEGDLVGRLDSIRRLHALAIASGDADPFAQALDSFYDGERDDATLELLS